MNGHALSQSMPSWILFRPIIMSLVYTFTLVCLVYTYLILSPITALCNGANHVYAMYSITYMCIQVCFIIIHVITIIDILTIKLFTFISHVMVYWINILNIGIWKLSTQDHVPVLGNFLCKPSYM